MPTHGPASLVLIAGLVACSLPREPGEPQAVPPSLAAGSPMDVRPEAGAAEEAPAILSPAPIAAPPPTPPRAPRSPFAFANDDPADDLVVAPPAPRPDCESALVAAGVKFAHAKIPVHLEGKGRTQLTCGAEQVVLYRGSTSGISYSPAPVMTCTMALALARFEVIVQEEAARTFGERVVRITQLGTYACREMAAYRGWVSEHAYANAIDVESFVFKSGRRLSVLQGFERGDDTRTRAGSFLRSVSQRAYDEETFSNVLTPFFDDLHRNHFHLDLARYRNDGTRPLEEDP